MHAFSVYKVVSYWTLLIEYQAVQTVKVLMFPTVH